MDEFGIEARRGGFLGRLATLILDECSMLSAEFLQASARHATTFTSVCCATGSMPYTDGARIMAPTRRSPPTQSHMATYSVWAPAPRLRSTSPRQ